MTSWLPVLLAAAAAAAQAAAADGMEVEVAVDRLLDLYAQQQAAATPSRAPPARPPTAPKRECLAFSRADALPAFGVEDPAAPHVLVLGSGGLVGAPLVGALRAKGYAVAEVKGRAHLDLRDPGALAVFDSVNITFAYFLACEVGGSKFLSSSQMQSRIVTENEKMYDVVLPWLEDRRIPYAFASSQLAVSDTPYGRIKSRGEDLVRASSTGKSFRFWNIYGFEFIGIKSHVVPDWLYRIAAAPDGDAVEIQSLTDGSEERQFLHTDESSAALIAYMEHFHDMQPLTDITSGVWTSLRSLGATIEGAFPAAKLSFRDDVAPMSAKGIEPALDSPLSKYWAPAMSMLDGIRDVSARFESYLQARQARAGTYVSFVVVAPDFDDPDVARNFDDEVAEIERFLGVMAEYAPRFHLRFEVIVMDCAVHASMSHPPLARTLRIPTAIDKQVRTLSVPRAKHPRLSSHRGATSVFQQVARNSAAGWARGDFVMFVDPRIILGPEMFAFLAKEHLVATAAYHAFPLLLADAPATGAAALAPPDLIAHCEETAQPLPNDGGRLCNATIRWRDSGCTCIHADAAADLLLISKPAFDSIRGYLEAPFAGNLDHLHSLMLAKAAGAGLELVQLTDMPVYLPPDVARASKRRAEVGQVLEQRACCFGPGTLQQEQTDDQ